MPNAAKRPQIHIGEGRGEGADAAGAEREGPDACINLGSFCGVLQGSGGVFAAFCNALGSFLLRSATIWGRFCCVLQRFGVVLLRSAMIWGSFAAFCNDLG